MSAQKSRKVSSGNSSGGWIFVLLLSLAFATGYYYYRQDQSHSASATKIVATPVPTPSATPTPVPSPEATPAPTPVPTPEATPTPEPEIPLTSLEKGKIPLQVRLLVPVIFQIRINGQLAGNVNAPAGIMVRLLKIESQTSLSVQFQQSIRSVPVASTDLLDRVRQLGQFGTLTNAAEASKAKPLPPLAGTAENLPTVKTGRGTLLSFDFASVCWPGLKAEPVGTIDVVGSKTPSSGLRAAQSLTSGPLEVKNSETELGKLTLAFCLSATAARPVTVRVESYSDGKFRTGGLETLIYPAAPDFYQRYALDLSTFKPSGKGTFNPVAPYLSFSFSLEGEPWKNVENPGFALDNVHFAVPAWYVSSDGSDTNDGRSEKKALATPQAALNQSEPGDIIVLMKGTYREELKTVAFFKTPGAPAAWTTLKNYPGQSPILSSNSFNTILISAGSKDSPSSNPSLAYLEVRGLHILGDGDLIKEKYPDSIGQPDGRSNTNGIAVDGRYCQNVPHHIRFADNLVEHCPAVGIGSIEGDWITVENNICRYNSWFTIYGTSGISLLGATNFDAVDNVYKLLVRNNISYRNECYQVCKKDGRLTDGNGIIIDVNQHTEAGPDRSYIGRTLVQSNLCYDNGGSGIHAFIANRVDIINNTAYLNSASKDLEYPQIFTARSVDCRIINNIVVAPVADVRNGEKPEPVAKMREGDQDIVFSHNLYFGGNIEPIMGKNDRVGDPGFVKPSRLPDADFRLQEKSRAIGKGTVESFSPYLDIEGKPRAAKPSLGAYER